MSNAFNQIHCMVEANLISSDKASQISRIMAGLPTTDSQLLLIIAATSLIGSDEFSPIYISENYTAKSKDDIIANTTTGAFSVTLPISPVIGEFVNIFDAQSTFATNNLTVNRNGQLINGSATNLILNTNGIKKTLVFNGGAKGWIAY